MRHKLQKNMTRYFVAAAVVPLMMCLFFVVGNTYARIRTQTVNKFAYTSKDAVQIYLGSGIDNKGNLIQGSNEWQTVTDNIKRLTVYVSNGCDGSVAADDQYVSFRLITSSGIQNVEDMSILMNIDDGAESRSFIGTATKIIAKSPLHQSHGDGWVIRFLDKKGKEIELPLLGGKLATMKCTLTISGMNVVDTSSITVEVNGSTSAN